MDGMSMRDDSGQCCGAKNVKQGECNSIDHRSGAREKSDMVLKPKQLVGCWITSGSVCVCRSASTASGQRRFEKKYDSLCVCVCVCVCVSKRDEK